MAADCRIIAIFASKYWALFGMDIAKAFEVAFNRKIEKNWEKMAEYRARFAEEGIHFDYANENPEVGNTSFQNFEVKLYFNVGIDDKFGFEPETDWVKVIEVLGGF